MIFNIGGKSGGGFAIPTFDGSHAVFGDEKQGYIECYSSGTITFLKSEVVDVFILGSGLCGAKGAAEGSGTSSEGYGRSTGGKGGNGAAGKTLLSQAVEKGSYSIMVGGACSSSATANASTAFGQTANTVASNGGKGGYAYAVWGSGDDSNNTSTSGTKGGNGTSYPFAESNVNATVNSDSIWYRKQLGAGGGGGGGRAAGWKYAGGYAGGTYGGGYGGKFSSTASDKQSDCTAGTANTGSGGGGGGSAAYGHTQYELNGKPGGSGIVIIRWGNWTA